MLVVLLALISQHRPFVAARGVVRTLEALPAGAREDAGQDLALLSAHSPHAGTTRDTFVSARGAAERLAGGYAFGLVGAVLWFALLGLPDHAMENFEIYNCSVTTIEINPLNNGGNRLATLNYTAHLATTNGT